VVNCASKRKNEAEPNTAPKKPKTSVPDVICLDLDSDDDGDAPPQLPPAFAMRSISPLPAARLASPVLPPPPMAPLPLPMSPVISDPPLSDASSQSSSDSEPDVIDLVSDDD